MRRLTDISPDSVSLLLPVYSYYSVLVSYRLLDDATYRLSDTFLDEATGPNHAKALKIKIVYSQILKLFLLF